MPTSTNARTATHPSARFSTNYGYRFVEDCVELHANFQLLNDTAHQSQWVLQLHASASDKSAAVPASTHLIAEAALPPIAEIAGAIEPFFLTTGSTPPAGNAAFILTLSLIARQAGQPDEIHDVALFARPERFIQPRLNGVISCDFSHNEVRLTIDAIQNPRDPANMSGTLSLELWALNTPYTGGAFEGMPLAGAILGRLVGQESWSCLTYALNYAPPIPGRWNVALMLREWTGAGYTTRDYRNLSEPLVIANTVDLPPATKVAASPTTEALAPTVRLAKTKSKTVSKKVSPKSGKSTAKGTTVPTKKSSPKTTSPQSSQASQPRRSPK